MYKRFFVSIVSISCLISIFFILIAYLFSGSLSNPTSRIVDEHKKIAQNIKTSKVLVISGSNTLLGINTELMSKKLNYPVINFGSNAGLRLDYIFYDAKKSIRDNDIVILPLEYGIYREDKLSNNRIIQICNDKEYLNELTLIDRLSFLYAVPFIIELKAICAFKDDLNYENTNEHGDIINKVGTKNTIYLKEPFRKEYTYMDTGTRETIIDFLSYCKEKNVKVFVTYPAYYYKQNYFDGYNLEQINKINQFWMEQDVTILGKYTDFIYTDKNDFYDTEYHLNIKGKEKRTEKLIELLKPYIDNN